MGIELINSITESIFGEGLIGEPSIPYSGLEDAVYEMYRSFIRALFPKYFAEGQYKDVREIMISEIARGEALLRKALSAVGHRSLEDADLFIEKLPGIAAYIDSDIDAAYRGDPAAKSRDEVIIAYPAFRAISAYRIAHEIHELGIPIIPRLLTEIFHRETGIDIHPGAKIGRSFFIDHGTGVVIGETCTIGDNVKLYQHVTLGAKSFAVGEDGILVKDIKRHPDIGNDVVIYSGATILGGDTVIGDRSVIGGNVWLTHSVEPDSTVIQKQ